MSDCTEEEMNEMMESVGEIQDILETNGYYTIDSRISEYANGLGLGEIGLDRDVSELSGGQRAKVLLAKVLLENPMILILDEPTNFLDENHINWLKNFLQNYSNAFILVSHDIPFLNSVVNVIYHVENAVLTRYTGDYENFQRMYALKKQQLEQAYEKQQKEIENVNTRLDNMVDVISLDKNSWRKDSQHLISKIATKIGGFECMKNVYQEVFKLVEERAGVALGTRLTNKRNRMAGEGVCKSKRDRFTKIDIIAEDKKLIEIYVAIVKEMAVKYGVC